MTRASSSWPTPSWLAEVDVAVVGAGAAGVAAGRALAAAGASFLLLEGRSRLGGRGWTLSQGMPAPLDLGCGWLHSGDINPWTAIAESKGFTVDRRMPPWGTQYGEHGFSKAEQRAYRAAASKFYDRIDALTDGDPDRPATELLEPGGRWNALLDAVSTYINGAELDRVSAQDWRAYADTEVNWRVVQGYGALIAAHGADLPVALDSPVELIEHGGARLRLHTPRGVLAARKVIVTVPSNILAGERLRFSPRLPDKIEAASRLPLGLADKLVLALDPPELLPQDAHLFGATDRAGTGSYHLRPLGRPVIECYFAGQLARDLEGEGEAGFARFAVDELAGHLGGDIRSHLRPLVATAWGRDPLALGSYSHALPGHGGSRAVLAMPVDDRLFFAGEACSAHAFSTAHGAHETGVTAARQALAALRHAS